MQKKIAKVVNYLSKAIDILDPFAGEGPVDCLWQEVSRLEEQINQQAEQIKILQAQVNALLNPPTVSPGIRWWTISSVPFTTGSTRPAEENKELDL